MVPADAPAGTPPAGDPLVDPAAATARMEQMRADPEFLKRVEAKDAAAFSECNKAWRVSRGLPAEPVQEINAENIFKETDARIAVETEKRADMLRGRLR